MRNRIFRKKEYGLFEQVPISVADFKALAVRNYEGTEKLQIKLLQIQGGNMIRQADEVNVRKVRNAQGGKGDI